MDLVEAADCGCTNYGPFCCKFAPQRSAEERGKGDTLFLLRHISKCLEAYLQAKAFDHRSACPVCSLVMVNYFFNIMYHHNTDSDEPLVSRMSKSRPQEGYVFPVIAGRKRRGADHVFDEEVVVRFDRDKVKDQVSKTVAMDVYTQLKCVYTHTETCIQFTWRLCTQTKSGVYPMQNLCIHKLRVGYTRKEFCVYTTML